MSDVFDNRRFFGLSAQGPRDGGAAASATATALGVRLRLVNIYRAWGWETPLPHETLEAIHRLGAVPEITWEPWDPREPLSSRRYALRAITTGTHDAYVRAWASAAAEYGRPLLIRFAHEMNGTWYPWAPAATGAAGEDYAAAYRHVHAIFTEAHAHNVKWVWCPNRVDSMPTDLGALWPGAAAVDYLALDAFNGAGVVSSMGGRLRPEDLLAESLQQSCELDPALPVLINETGCACGCGDCIGWVDDLLGFLSAEPRVNGLVWFNFDKPAEADWRIDATPEAVTAAGLALHHW